MGYKNFLLHMEDQIAVVSFNRPESFNALSKGLLMEFRDLLKELEADQSVRVVILTGAGDKAFVAGADISELQGMSSADALAYSALGQSCFSFIENMEKVVIAAVNGFALGGGLEVALACDFIIASENAQFGLPEVTLGVMPGFGGTQRLPKAVGIRMARQLAYSGERIKAKQAMALGIVNRVVPAEALMDEAKKMADKITANSFHAVSACKHAINSGSSMDLYRGCEFERRVFALTFDYADAKEGITAFLEKRAPKFE